jgi:hypothetical protein
MKWLMPLVLLVMLSGWTDQDPFGFSRRSLGAGYELESFIEGGYYIHRGGNSLFPKEHLLEGSVSQVGVNQKHIVALRQPHFGGDAADWMVIDKASHEISGPLRREMITQDPQLGTIEIRPAYEAFNQLPPTRFSVIAFAITLGVVGVVIGHSVRKKQRQRSATQLADEADVRPVT